MFTMISDTGKRFLLDSHLEHVQLGAGSADATGVVTDDLYNM